VHKRAYYNTHPGAKVVALRAAYVPKIGNESRAFKKSQYGIVFDVSSTNRGDS
jgi:hypothetical protein